MPFNLTMLLTLSLSHGKLRDAISLVDSLEKITPRTAYLEISLKVGWNFSLFGILGNFPMFQKVLLSYVYYLQSLVKNILVKAHWKLTRSSSISYKFKRSTMVKENKKREIGNENSYVYLWIFSLSILIFNFLMCGMYFASWRMFLRKPRQKKNRRTNIAWNESITFFSLSPLQCSIRKFHVFFQNRSESSSESFKESFFTFPSFWLIVLLLLLVFIDYAATNYTLFQFNWIVTFPRRKPEAPLGKLHEKPWEWKLGSIYDSKKSLEN